jgi:hypothetical protein
MAIPANTRETYGGVQIREDLSDIIYNISPMDTPFVSGAGRGSADNTIFQWQRDELATAAANQKKEGDDPASLAVVEPELLKNYTQISEKAVQTSGTAEAVDWAGRKSSQAYQLAKRAKEIKRDMELMLTGNDTATVGASGTARKTAACMSWMGNSTAGDSNLINGPTAAAVANTGNGNGTAVTAVAGTVAVLTMAMINTCVEQIWKAGGSPDILMCRSDLKVKMSALAGSVVADIVSNHDKASPASAINSVDVIVTDFGTFKIVPNRFCLAQTMYLLDMDFWSVDYLRPFQTETLAKTGDSIKQMMVAEYGLRGKNGHASGAVIGVKAA